MKILSIGKILDIVFMDNSRLTVTEASVEAADNLYNKVLALHDNEEAAKELLLPRFGEAVKRREEALGIDEKISEHKELKRVGDYYVFKDISEISVPMSVIKAFMLAKEQNDEIAIKSILNFWTLASNLKDSRVRNNIFWYCEIYSIKITEEGLLRLYRNAKIHKRGSVIPAKRKEEKVEQRVDTKEAKETDHTTFISQEFIRVRTVAKKNPENFTVIISNGMLMSTANEKKIQLASKVIGNLKKLYLSLSDVPKPQGKIVKEKKVEEESEEEVLEEGTPTIFTDSHSGTTRIQIGRLVTMKREECDTNQNNTCSRGLHGASKQWIEDQGVNYFGNVTLSILVNPMDIVAIPPIDGYGKLRFCAYLAIKIVERAENGRIIDETYDSSFAGKFFENLDYSKGAEADSEADVYCLVIPNIPEINKAKSLKSLEFLKRSIAQKVVKG